MFSYFINHYMFDWSEKGKDRKRAGEGGYNLPWMERKEGEIGCELKMSNKHLSKLLSIIIIFFLLQIIISYIVQVQMVILLKSIIYFLSLFLSTKQRRAMFIFYHSTFLFLQLNTHQEKYKYFLSNNMITTSSSNTHEYKL